MFLVRFMRRLLALPFSVAAGVSAFLSPAVAYRFYKLVWWIGGDDHPGHLALARLAQSAGPAVARDVGREMLRRRPSPEIACFIGLLEIGCGDVDEARTCLAVARQMGGDRQGLTEVLAYHAEVGCADDAEQAGRLIEALSLRDDLSPAASKLVLEGMMWRTLAAGDLDRARRRAMHLLAVSDNPQAQIVMGALHQRDGRHDKAAKCFASSTPLPTTQRLYFRCMASAAAGSGDELAEALAALKAEDAELGGRMESQFAAAEGGQ